MVESLDCGVEYAMRVCPVRIMRKTPIGNGKRSRENRISDSESTFGDSRSSSCSQKDGAGDQDVVVTEETTKECDMVELMGQWSPVLSTVVSTRQQNDHSDVHHHSHTDAHHHHPHNHIHHPHNHIHHPHSHHSHHRSSHNNNNNSQQAVVAAGGVSEGKSGEFWRVGNLILTTFLTAFFLFRFRGTFDGWRCWWSFRQAEVSLLV